MLGAAVAVAVIDRDQLCSDLGLVKISRQVHDKVLLVLEQHKRDSSRLKTRQRLAHACRDGGLHVEGVSM